MAVSGGGDSDDGVGDGDFGDVGDDAIMVFIHLLSSLHCILPTELWFGCGQLQTSS